MQNTHRVPVAILRYFTVIVIAPNVESAKNAIVNLGL